MSVLFVYTVEPPKRGHFGNGPFVLSSEVVPISEVHHILMFFAICRSLLVFNSNVELSVLQMHASDFIWTQGKLFESIWTRM